MGLSVKLKMSIALLSLAAGLLPCMAAQHHLVSSSSSAPDPNSSNPGQAPDCEGRSHIEEMQCQGRRLKALDDELNRVYKLALAAIPEKDDQDARKDRDQLRSSERAWLSYLRENCALIGGLEGGSNSWVSTFEGDCEEKELANRIAFLSSIANGTFGT
jgi:uncharacterized protein YecT (DUF1311 family)